MTTDQNVIELYNSLSLETVADLASQEVLKLVDLMAEYKKMLPDVSDEENARVHKNIVPIRKAIQNVCDALSMWRHNHEIFIEAYSELGLAVFSRTLSLQMELVRLSMFESHVMTDGEDRRVRLLLPYLLEPSGSMHEKKGECETYTILAPEIELPPNFTPEDPTHYQAAIEALLKLGEQGKELEPGKLNPFTFYFTDGEEGSGKE